jgi:hypothetical protein
LTQLDRAGVKNRRRLEAKVEQLGDWDRHVQKI